MSGGGYGSDGSIETLMSACSAQSMQNKTLLRQHQLQRLREIGGPEGGGGQSSTEEFGMGCSGAMDAAAHLSRSGELRLQDEMDLQEDLQDSPRSGTGGVGQQDGSQTQQQKSMMTSKEMKDRKKSLMTRLIPGRNGPNGIAKKCFDWL